MTLRFIAPVHPPEAPNQANLWHWYDFTDSATLWLDEAGTMPVTADGDVIARCDDKGIKGDNITNASAANRPEWDPDGRTGALWDGSDVLSKSVVPDGLVGLTRTTACVYYRDSVGTLLLNWMQWHSNELSGLHWDLTSNPGGPSIRLYSTFAFADFTGPSVAPMDETMGVIMVHRTGPGRMEGISSATAISACLANTAFDAPADGQDLTIGAFSGGGANGWTGNIMEVLIWGTDLTPTELDELKAYFLAKHGVTFA